MDQGLSYLKGPTDVPLRPITVGGFVEELKDEFEDVIIISSIEQKKTLTTQEFFEETDNFAAALYDSGLKRGDKIGIIVNNSVEALVANYGCIKGGFVLVNLNPALQPRELEYYMKTLQISCIVCVDKYKSFNILDTIKKIVPELGESSSEVVDSKSVPSLKLVIVISDEQYRGTTKFKSIMSLGKSIPKETLTNFKNQIDTHDIFTILFTSGSTGNPKMVGLTHHQFANCLNVLKMRLPLLQEKGNFCFYLPLFHIFGLGFCLLCISHGVTITLPSLYYNPEKNLRAISDEGCTWIMGTPTMLADLIRIQKELNLPLSPTIAISGGAAGSTQLFKDVLEILKIKQLRSGYGMSETAAAVWPVAEDFNDFKSVGTLCDHLEAKIVDNEGTIVPIGTIGELYLRGYSIIKKYLNCDSELLDQDGWFKTGDAVYVDKNGKIYITGRLKDIINRGGEKISPAEVEELLQSYPNIVEVYVVGTYHERLGEEVCACIKLTSGTTVTLEEVKNYCKGKLSYYKIPTRIEIMDSFPKTLIGKIQKSKLTELVNNVVVN